jgi:hypothetical protein
MRVVEAGFTPSEYVETLRTADMSFGTYLIPVGGVDVQVPGVAPKAADDSRLAT